MSEKARSRREAAEVYESWLLAEEDGEREDFEALVRRHPELEEALRWLARADAAALGALQESESAPTTTGRRIGDFRVLHELGRGGMGIVMAAEQVSLQRTVALKVLPAQLTLNERALGRFRHEAEITGRLNHRGIIDIHQIGEAEGVHFIAMELVEGASLDKAIERMRGESFGQLQKQRIGDVVAMEGLGEGDDDGPLVDSGREGSKKGSSSASNKNYIETAVKLVCQVADALQHAHEAGVIHRDVKPSNILVRPNGSAVLTDFGLARQEGLPSLSATGEFAGTPNYVSPEQAMGGRVPVDTRSDVWSLGASLYELLTLERAFPGETSHEVLAHILHKAPIPPQKHNPALAPDLVTIVLKALEKDPDRRYASAAELAEDLRAFVEYRPIRAKRTPTVVRAWRWVRREPLRAGFGMTVAIALVVVGLLWGRLSSRESVIEAGLVVPELVDRGLLALVTDDVEEATSLFEEALARSEENFDARLGLTLTRLRAGDPDGAAAELDKTEGLPGYDAGAVDRAYMRCEQELGQDVDLESLDPPTTAMALLLEASLVQYARPAEGVSASEDRRRRAAHIVELLESAVLRPGDQAAPLLVLAQAVRDLEDVAAAKRVAGALAARVEDDLAGSWEAWNSLSDARWVFDEQGCGEAALRALEINPDAGPPRQKLITLGVLEPTEESSATDLSNRAMRLNAEGRYAEAEELAALAVERGGGVAAWYILGTSQMNQGKLDDAREAFAGGMEMGVPDSVYLNNYATCLINLGLRDQDQSLLTEAESLLGEAIEGAPGSPDMLHTLGALYLTLERNEEAAAAFEEAIAIHEAGRGAGAGVPLATLWSKLGRALSVLDYDASAEALWEAATLDPKNAQYWEYVAQIEQRRGNEARATDAYRELLFLREGDEGLYGEVLRRLRNEGRRRDLVDLCEWRIERVPDDVDAWNQLAWQLVDPDGEARLRDPERGLEAAEEADRLADSADAEIADTLAWALEASGRHEEAIGAAQRGLRLAGTPELRATLEATLSRLEGE